MVVYLIPSIIIVIFLFYSIYAFTIKWKLYYYNMIKNRANILNKNIQTSPDEFIESSGIYSSYFGNSYESYKSMIYDELYKLYVVRFFNLNRDVIDNITQQVIPMIKNYEQQCIEEVLKNEFKYIIFPYLNRQDKLYIKYLHNIKSNMTEAEKIERDAVALIKEKYGEDDDILEPELHKREDILNQDAEEDKYPTFDDIKKYNTVEFE